MNFKNYSTNFLETRKEMLVDEIKRIESDILTFPITTNLGIVSLKFMKYMAEKELQKINEELKLRGEITNEN